MILWPVDPVTGEYLSDGIPVFWRFDFSKPVHAWGNRITVCVRELSGVTL